MNANKYFEKHNNFEKFSVVNLYKEEIIRLMEDYFKYKLKEYKEHKCKEK